MVSQNNHLVRLEDDFSFLEAFTWARDNFSIFKYQVFSS